MNDSEKKQDGPVGGLAFFSSLFFLIFLALFNVLVLPGLIDATALANLAVFLGALSAGVALGHFCIRGHTSVFIHELKHSIVSNFAGNKAKGMLVKSGSGHFKYQYTSKTAAYNAFISLAPYWLPLFTSISLGVAAVFWRGNHYIMISVAGLAYGADSILNYRDISPIQTDFSNIRGGFQVGLTYVVAMNLTLATILLAYVFHGIEGLTFLVKALWLFLSQFFPGAAELHIFK